MLRAIPGLELVDTAQPSVGYMCNTLQSLPAFKRDLHRELLEAAAAAKVDALAGVYHVCHRELCSHERDWPFEVVNFLELIGESMGSRREDRFKRLKKLQDVGADPGRRGGPRQGAWPAGWRTSKMSSPTSCSANSRSRWARVPGVEFPPPLRGRWPERPEGGDLIVPKRPPHTPPPALRATSPQGGEEKPSRQTNRNDATRQ